MTEFESELIDLISIVINLGWSFLFIFTLYLIFKEK